MASRSPSQAAGQPARDAQGCVFPRCSRCAVRPRPGWRCYPCSDPQCGADASAGPASGITSRLANVTVGAWNGAPCTEDDPLRAASSGGAEVPVIAAAEPPAQGQETCCKAEEWTHGDRGICRRTKQ